MSNIGVDLDSVFGFGFGDLDDDRLSLLGGSLPVAPTAANSPFAVKPDTANLPFAVDPVRTDSAAEYSVSIGAGGTYLGLGSNDANIANRRAVTVTNAGAGPLWVSGVNSGLPRGVRIGPLSDYYFETGAELYVHNPNAFAVRVTALAELFS